MESQTVEVSRQVKGHSNSSFNPPKCLCHVVSCFSQVRGGQNLDQDLPVDMHFSCGHSSKAHGLVFCFFNPDGLDSPLKYRYYLTFVTGLFLYHF